VKTVEECPYCGAGLEFDSEALPAPFIERQQRAARRCPNCQKGPVYGPRYERPQTARSAGHNAVYDPQGTGIECPECWLQQPLVAHCADCGTPMSDRDRVIPDTSTR
jgi:primosomal protein N'